MVRTSEKLVDRSNLGNLPHPIDTLRVIDYKRNL
jgi:hypothetical protein